MKNHIALFSKYPTLNDIRKYDIKVNIHSVIKNPSKIQLIKEYKWLFTQHEIETMFPISDNTVEVLYFDMIQDESVTSRYILSHCSEHYIINRLNVIKFNSISFKHRSKRFMRKVKKYYKFRSASQT